MAETDARLIQIFLEVTAIEGLSGQEKNVADYIKTFISKLNLTAAEDSSGQISHGNSGNIICKIGNGGDTVLLSHMDTARSTKNVKPFVQKDRIVSDGNTILGADNRAGVAILLYSLEKIIHENNRTPDFTLAFTICEETSMAGSRNLSLDHVKQGFVFDSSLRPGNFIYKSYGAQSFDVTVFGRAAHSGIAPEKGVHAIKIAADAIGQLDLGRIEEHTTMNIGLIQGGSAVNVIPDQTFVKGEIRSLHSKRVMELSKYVENVFHEKALKYGGRLEFNSWWDFKPYIIPEDQPVFRRIYKAIEKSGLKPTPAITAGGSDANSLNAKGIPSINVGIGAQNPHANDEFIYLEDLQNSSQIAIQLINNGNV